MARDFFKLPPANAQGVSGTIVTDIQASLNATTAFDIAVDGNFGHQTGDALSGFQRARGLPVTGTVSDTTWPALMRSAEPPIFERCLQVVAAFEGTGFTLIEGNFDGAGLTWGIIGFTLRDGELGEVLGEINTRFPELFNAAFGHDGQTILDIAGPGTSAARKIGFANSITTQRSRVAEPWNTCFATLGKQREVQRLQVERAREKYWTAIALRDAADLGMAEELDLLLLYDVAVQDGGMRSKGRLADAQALLPGAGTAAERRQIVADVVSASIDGQFQNDVRSRKNCIATGRGAVHGANFSLDIWGFQDGAVASP